MAYCGSFLLKLHEWQIIAVTWIFEFSSNNSFTVEVCGIFEDLFVIWAYLQKNVSALLHRNDGDLCE